MDRSYLTPNGKRVYTVRQMLNDSLSYRIVTVPYSNVISPYNSSYSSGKRWPDFRYRHEAQDALDTFARENDLEEY